MLENIAWISLVIAFARALIIAIDEFRRPQRMWIRRFPDTDATACVRDLLVRCSEPNLERRLRRHNNIMSSCHHVVEY